MFDRLIKIGKYNYLFLEIFVVGFLVVFCLFFNFCLVLEVERGFIRFRGIKLVFYLVKWKILLKGKINR